MKNNLERKVVYFSKMLFHKSKEEKKNPMDSFSKFYAKSDNHFILATHTHTHAYTHINSGRKPQCFRKLY